MMPEERGCCQNYKTLGLKQKKILPEAGSCFNTFFRADLVQNNVTGLKIGTMYYL
jgi:hypothetical protein